MGYEGIVLETVEMDKETYNVYVRDNELHFISNSICGGSIHICPENYFLELGWSGFKLEHVLTKESYSFSNLLKRTQPLINKEVYSQSFTFDDKGRMVFPPDKQQPLPSGTSSANSTIPYMSPEHFDTGQEIADSIIKENNKAKDEGLCPICYTAGPFINLQPVCPEHGPY